MLSPPIILHVGAELCRQPISADVVMLMMTNDRPLTLPTADDVSGWKSRVIEIDAMIVALNGQRDALRRMVDAAEQFAEAARNFEFPFGDSAAPIPPSNRSPVLMNSEARSDISFKSAVLDAVQQNVDGVSIAQLRREIEAGPLGDRFRVSDKGFYHATSRLKKAHDVTEYRGFLFTPENLSAFKERVALGTAADKVAGVANRRGSAMTDRIVEIVASSPGIMSKDLVEKIVAEGFTLSPNSALNTIARLRKIDFLREGDDTRQLMLGTSAPISPDHENGEAEASPDDEGGATPSFLTKMQSVSDALG